MEVCCFSMVRGFTERRHSHARHCFTGSNSAVATLPSLHSLSLDLQGCKRSLARKTTAVETDRGFNSNLGCRVGALPVPKMSFSILSTRARRAPLLLSFIELSSLRERTDLTKYTLSSMSSISLKTRTRNPLLSLSASKKARHSHSHPREAWVCAVAADLMAHHHQAPIMEDPGAPLAMITEKETTSMMTSGITIRVDLGDAPSTSMALQTPSTEVATVVVRGCPGAP